MTAVDEWELFVSGSVEQALHAFRNNYRKYGSEGSLSNCGLALLDLERFVEAISVFEEIRRAELRGRTTSETTLVKLGVARWCSGDQTGALREWEMSIDTDYADEAGGVQGPATLWFGAMKTGDRLREQKAIRALEKFWNSRLLGAKRWPGPAAIAGFILGNVDEQLFVHGWAKSPPILEARRKCKALFWAGVKQKNQSIAVKYFTAARANRHAVLEPEFYLAKCVCAETSR